MRVVFAGTPEVAATALQAVLASRHEVVAVVTRPDAPAGRGRRLVGSPVAEVSRGLGIETLTPVKVRDPEFQARLRELAPDACPVVAYGGLIPPSALRIPTHGWINLHFSLLPAWRGAAPVQHSIISGDDVTGACTFEIERGLDTGPVYGMLTESIRPTDTSGDLLERLAVSGSQLLVATLDGIEDGTLRAVPQPADGVSLAPKIEVEDARIDWNAPAMRIDRLIRGCTPAPGAWTEFRGQRLKVLPLAQPPSPDLVPARPEPLAPGEVHVQKNRIWVGTGTHAVLLGQVQAQGKKPMAAGDWARGTRVEAGERCE